MAGPKEAVSCKLIDLFGLRTTVPIPEKCNVFAVPVGESTAGAMVVFGRSEIFSVLPAQPNLGDDMELVFMPCIRYNHNFADHISYFYGSYGLEE